MCTNSVILSSVFRNAGCDKWRSADKLSLCIETWIWMQIFCTRYHWHESRAQYILKVFQSNYSISCWFHAWIFGLIKISYQSACLSVNIWLTSDANWRQNFQHMLKPVKSHIFSCFPKVTFLSFCLFKFNLSFHFYFWKFLLALNFPCCTAAPISWKYLALSNLQQPEYFIFFWYEFYNSGWATPR